MCSHTTPPAPQVALLGELPNARLKFVEQQLEALDLPLGSHHTLSFQIKNVGTTSAAFRLTLPKDAAPASTWAAAPSSPVNAAPGAGTGLDNSPSSTSMQCAAAMRRSQLDPDCSSSSLPVKAVAVATLAYSCPGLSSIEFSPARGRLGPGEVAEVEVELVACQAGSLSAEVLVEVRGGGLMRLPLKVVAVAPRVEVRGRAGHGDVGDVGAHAVQQLGM